MPACTPGSGAIMDLAASSEVAFTKAMPNMFGSSGAKSFRPANTKLPALPNESKNTTWRPIAAWSSGVQLAGFLWRSDRRSWYKYH